MKKQTPEWLDLNRIDEILFCQEFLQEHPMICVKRVRRGHRLHLSHSTQELFEISSTTVRGSLSSEPYFYFNPRRIYTHEKI